MSGIQVLGDPGLEPRRERYNGAVCDEDVPRQTGSNRDRTEAIPRQNPRYEWRTDHPQEHQWTQRISAAYVGRPKLIPKNRRIHIGEWEPCAQRTSSGEGPHPSGLPAGHPKERNPIPSIYRRGISIPSFRFLWGPRRLDGFDGHRMDQPGFDRVFRHVPDDNRRKHVRDARETHEHET